MVILNDSKKYSLIFGSVFVGAALVLATIVFPFWNLIREDVFEEVTILNNDNGVCYVETNDKVPKKISDCKNLPGDKVTIKFGKDLAWAQVIEN